MNHNNICAVDEVLCGEQKKIIHAKENKQLEDTSLNNAIYTMENKKREWLDVFLNDRFVIFPCDTDNIPIINKWNKLDVYKSYNLYNVRNTDKHNSRKINYEKNNTGLLCGICSGIIVINVKINDNGMTYWNKLIEENGDVKTLKVTSGSNEIHYYFKWNDKMRNWRTKNKIFSTVNNKIGIDLETDDGYVILPPSNHHETQELYKFENIDEPCNLRNKIKNMPVWLFKKINDYMINLYDHMDCENDVHTYIYGIYKGLSLEDVPNHLKTKEICEFAVAKHDNALKFVPEHLMTKEICKIAVTYNYDTLKFVPEHLRTKEICEIAVAKGCSALKYVPEQLITNELCIAAVTKHKQSMEYVPENMKTMELCALAVNKQGTALKYVPLKFKTTEICTMAIKKDGYAIRYVPDNLITKELCEIAVRRSNCALGQVPEHFFTKELYKLAIENHGYALAVCYRKTNNI